MRLLLSLLAWLTRVYGLGIPLSSRQPGQFTEFQGKRVCFGSVKEVRVPLAGATREELQEALAETPGVLGQARAQRLPLEEGLQAPQRQQPLRDHSPSLR